MEVKVNKFGIIDFFSAFGTDVEHNSKRYTMSDLKSKDWEVVSKEVKEELTMKSQKRIEKIEEVINVLKTKMKNSFAKNQRANNNYSSEKTTNVIQKEEMQEENIK